MGYRKNPKVPPCLRKVTKFINVDGLKKHFGIVFAVYPT